MPSLPSRKDPGETKDGKRCASWTNLEREGCIPFAGTSNSSSWIFFAVASPLGLSPAKSQRESIYPNIPDFSQSPSAGLLLMYRQMISWDLCHIRPLCLIYLKCIYELWLLLRLSASHLECIYPPIGPARRGTAVVALPGRMGRLNGPIAADTRAVAMSGPSEHLPRLVPLPCEAPAPQITARVPLRTPAPHGS